ncbi:MAG TPA: hypothetical protein VF120_05680 [Ktedonobacterales bacterium]
MQQPTTPTPDLTDEEREERRQEQIRRNQAALSWLDELDREDPEEQRRRWEVVERTLKEDPIRFRKPAL